MSNAANLKGPWRKGQSGNPAGKARMPEELRAVNSMTPPELAKIISKYFRCTREELQEIAIAAAAPALELAIASILVKSIQYGDYGRLNFLLDRCVGKPLVQTEMEHDGDLADLSDADLVARIRQFLPKLEKRA